MAGRKLLNGIAKRGLEADFHVEYSTPSRIFRADSSMVRGIVEIRPLKTVKKVTKVEIGFKGKIINKFRHVYVTYTITMSGATTRVTEHESVYDLFDELHTVEEHDKPVDLNLGDSISKEFMFSFPTSESLPSSTDLLGGEADNQGNCVIQYSLYVRVHHKEEIFKSGPLEYEYPILYQGSCASYAPDTFKIVRHPEVFKAKMKKKVWDSKKQQLVPNPIAKPRKFTRGIRQLWNDNYKPENFGNLAQDVELTCDFIFCDNFNLQQPLKNLIKFRLCVPGGPELDQNYQINGESTGLGQFAITDIALRVFHDVDLFIDGFVYSTKERRDLFSATLDKPLEVDVAKDFQYDAKNERWINKFGMEELVGMQSEIPLINLLVKPVLCTYHLIPYVRVETSILIRLGINNMNTDSETISFVAHVPAVVNYFEPLPAYREDTPPPSFTMAIATDVDAEGFDSPKSQPIGEPISYEEAMKEHPAEFLSETSFPSDTTGTGPEAPGSDTPVPLDTPNTTTTSGEDHAAAEKTG